MVAMVVLTDGDCLGGVLEDVCLKKKKELKMLQFRNRCNVFEQLLDE